MRQGCSPRNSKGNLLGLKNRVFEYNEIPDCIWERIQNILYNKATETINKELKSAKASVKYWEEKLFEFDNKLKLNE